jgi:hypothetical protein
MVSPVIQPASDETKITLLPLANSVIAVGLPDIQAVNSSILERNSLRIGEVFALL